MNLSRPELNIANFGDLHLGHRQNSAREIALKLVRALPDNAETAALDIIFFTGDVFDTRMQLSDEHVPQIQMWIAHVLTLCKKYDILIRVLEGTPGHDWKQSQLFESINAVTGIGANLKYVKTLSIEYIEQYGISVLYVPDEANPTTEKTLSQVRELMRAKGLDQVDFAVMHGQFDFQLPPHIKVDRHDSAAYLALVKELILVGHVHTYCRFDRILPPGSFDRLTHGQEEPKGHLRIIARRNREYDVQFIENKEAKSFITVPCCGLSLDDTMLKIQTMVSDLRDDSYVRIEVDSTNPILTNMEEVIRRYPFLNMSKIVRKDKKEEEVEAERAATFKPITLTKDNLAELLMERVVASLPSASVLEAARSLLKEAS